jgi:major type 1 subunit fimbrin (pilin)
MTLSPPAFARPPFYAACGSALLFAAAAHAGSGSGTIEFKGEITGQTCDIDVGGSGVLKSQAGPATTIAITLDKIGVNAFSAVGSVAGNKDFQIKLTNCGAAATTAKLAFDSALPAPQGTASGVTFVLLNAGAEIDVSHARDVATTTISGGEGVFALMAAYKSTSETIKAGTLSTSVPFTLSYQ